MRQSRLNLRWSYNYEQAKYDRLFLLQIDKIVFINMFFNQNKKFKNSKNFSESPLNYWIKINKIKIKYEFVLS